MQLNLRLGKQLLILMCVGLSERVIVDVNTPIAETELP